ncbi:MULTISPECIES: type II toxin-antitoxin system PemK/MazF family toxin [unclassified Flavobacterium]|jgi:mRNA interferase MazF|uniref:type II toxin-antitoxin system PemK/MazF family toxin n=1 Tax=unclassified Flavobacterium TaxID=196869 RepID=UPI0025BAF55B|nr:MULTISPECIES: type II toxin-antitoxin system PemK/MazF family toxin [unclassified Flavobacterium]
MKKGDIVLLSFPFTDLKGKKIRPALVLVVSDLDVIVAFVTTQFKWQNSYDILLEPDNFNGLKKSSLVRLSKITTIDKDLILGKLGELNTLDLQKINNNLIKILEL